MFHVTTLVGRVVLQLDAFLILDVKNMRETSEGYFLALVRLVIAEVCYNLAASAVVVAVAVIVYDNHMFRYVHTIRRDLNHFRYEKLSFRHFFLHALHVGIVMKEREFE